MWYARKQIRNLGFDGRTCLDSPARKKDLRKAVNLYPCHSQGGNQVDTHLFLVHFSTQVSHHTQPRAQRAQNIYTHRRGRLIFFYCSVEN